MAWVVVRKLVQRRVRLHHKSSPLNKNTSGIFPTLPDVVALGDNYIIYIGCLMFPCYLVLLPRNMFGPQLRLHWLRCHPPGSGMLRPSKLQGVSEDHGKKEDNKLMDQISQVAGGSKGCHQLLGPWLARGLATVGITGFSMFIHPWKPGSTCPGIRWDPSV